MAAIDVDWDVFRALTARRPREDVTVNDVLREMLGLDPPHFDPPAGGGCTMLGVHFPEGTKFRVTFKGRTYTAEIQNGAWIGGDGRRHRSPSGAASAITHTNVNGWRFWEVKRPEDAGWRKMASLLP